MTGKRGCAIWQRGLYLILVMALASISHHAFAAGGTWTTKASMLQAIQNSQAGVTNGKLYIAGGDNQGNPSATNMLQVYDPVTNTWAAKAPLPTPVWAHAVGNRRQALCGRRSEYGAYWGNQLQVYDAASDTWTTKAPLSTFRGTMASGVINGKLYVAGGKTPDSGQAGPCHQVNMLQEYDRVQYWTTKAPMPTARRRGQGRGNL